MPVDTPSTDYSAAIEEWLTVRDCVRGLPAILEGKERYLPKLTKQEAAEYDKYQKRAVFFNATARTLEAMVGLLFRKPPEITLPESFGQFLSDADMRGNPFVSYARSIANEVAGLGRAGTLIDWSEDEKRPYVASYTAEKIINWQTSRIGGRTMLTMLVLKEQSVTSGDDPFVPKTGVQYRVLRLDAAAVNSEVWRKNTKGEFEMQENFQMVRKGKALNAIPFVFHNADMPGPEIGRIPLADLAHVNIAHFRTSADLENGRHICGLPTPYAFGLEVNSDTTKDFMLGASYAWTSTNAQAKAGFLEFTGQGLGALEKGLEEKEKQMAALGARLIEPPKKDAEAYETVQLRAGAEASTLARIGLLTTEGLVQVLAWASWWQGSAATMTEAAEGVIFALNKDFVSAAITPEMLTAIIAARQANLISADTMFFNLQRGEFYPDGHTAEDEADLIDAAPPMPPPLPINPNTNG